MKQVIGLCGFANSGKSTVALYLQRQYGFRRLSFATAVKDITAAAFGWEREKLEGVRPEDRTWRNTPDVFWSERLKMEFTPRYALQMIGTNIFRNQVHANIWSDLIIRQIDQMADGAKVVIDDVRFVNERSALRSIGAKFAIIQKDIFESPEHERLFNAAWNQHHHDLQSEKLHSSEWDWLRDTAVTNDKVIFNRGSYDELYAEVDAWYNKTVVRLV